MKKLLWLLCAVLVSICVVSCQKEQVRRKRLGILAPAVTHGWVSAVAYFAQEHANKLKAEDPNLEVKFLTSSSAEEMTAQIDELIAWNADAIVAYPQWTGMEVPISNALKNGIKVVNFDIEINAKGTYMVSGDNEGMGRASAKYILSKLSKAPADMTIVALTVPTAGSVSELRLKGFNAVMKSKAPQAKIIERATKFTREDGLKDFADILTAEKNIDAVFSMDDELSIGVLQAIQEAKRTDIKVITGGGGCQEYYGLMNKTQDIWLMSASYSPSMIKDAIDVAMELMADKTDVPLRKVIPTRTSDRESNADLFDSNCPY